MTLGPRMDEAYGQSVPTRPLEVALARYLKALGIVVVLYAVLQWIFIVDSAFVALPLARQILYGGLAVLLPVAGVGLWMATRWGVTLWVLLALMIACVHTVFADIFGFRPVVAGISGLSVMVLFGLLAGVRRGYSGMERAADETITGRYNLITLLRRKRNIK